MMKMMKMTKMMIKFIEKRKKAHPSSVGGLNCPKKMKFSDTIMHLYHCLCKKKNNFSFFY